MALIPHSEDVVGATDMNTPSVAVITSSAVVQEVNCDGGGESFVVSDAIATADKVLSCVSSE